MLSIEMSMINNMQDFNHRVINKFAQLKNRGMDFELTRGMSLAQLSTHFGEWPSKLTDGVRKMLVERGPVQVKHIGFPLDSKVGMLCFACKVFGNANSSLAGDQGYSDWRNLAKIFISHEKSLNHIKNCQYWRELTVRLRSDKTIDKENERIIRAETEHRNQVLKNLLCALQFLGTRGLSFREYIDKFDVVMAEHVRRVTPEETYVHYLSKNIRNEFISLLSTNIQDMISNELKQAAY
ncbi:hypothetical protein PR048_021034 [Dryococelus australis]|uniref:Uncharacterized protein n=1 Tax=Dryococelus australis TaxID=614101 RepID=A0ABQ9GX40_9NEOP|nr:hypothetical protein PR048_021034 [Dryococelus australis]